MPVVLIFTKQFHHSNICMLNILNLNYDIATGQTTMQLCEEAEELRLRQSPGSHRYWKDTQSAGDPHLIKSCNLNILTINNI